MWAFVKISLSYTEFLKKKHKNLWKESVQKSYPALVIGHHILTDQGQLYVSSTSGLSCSKDCPEFGVSTVSDRCTPQYNKILGSNALLKFTYFKSNEEKDSIELL